MQSKTTTIIKPAADPDRDLAIAEQELTGVVIQTSRVACALRSIGRAMSDEGNPIDPQNIGGLCEAVELIGEYIEGYAVDRLALVERIAGERRGA